MLMPGHDHNNNSKIAVNGNAGTRPKIGSITGDRCKTIIEAHDRSAATQARPCHPHVVLKPQGNADRGVTRKRTPAATNQLGLLIASLTPVSAVEEAHPHNLKWFYCLP